MDWLKFKIEERNYYLKVLKGKEYGNQLNWEDTNLGKE